MSSDHSVSELERQLDEILQKDLAYVHLVVCPLTPLEELLSKEEQRERSPDEIRSEVRQNAFRDMWSYFFQEGPVPLHVLRYVFALARAVRPELLGGLSVEDIRSICDDGDAATEELRIARIYRRALPVDRAAAIEKRVAGVLSKWKTMAHLARPPRMALSTLLDVAEVSDEITSEIRLDTFRHLLGEIFQWGHEPVQVLRYVIGQTKAVRPELLGDMSLEDISIICADGGRATVSVRIKRIYNDRVASAGMVARASFQKAGNYSSPQIGNKNRVADVSKRRVRN